MYGLTPPGPWIGPCMTEGPTFLFIKLESWNFIRISGEKFKLYMWVDSHMDRQRALLEGRRPQSFKTFFLFFKTEDWNLVCIMFIQNQIQWYAYVWFNPPKGRETALAWGRRPHLLVYQDRKLKFGINIWRIIIYIHVGWLSNGPQNDHGRKPSPPPLPSIFKNSLVSRWKPKVGTPTVHIKWNTLICMGVG